MIGKSNITVVKAQFWWSREDGYQGTKSVHTEPSKHAWYIQEYLGEEIEWNWKDELKQDGLYEWSGKVIGHTDYWGEYDEEWIGDVKLVHLTGWEKQWIQKRNKNIKRMGIAS